MVKILVMGAVYAGQRPATPLGISADSARPVRDEFRFWIGSVRDRPTGRGHAPVGRRGRPGSWRTPSATQCSRVGRCTYVRGIFGCRPALVSISRLDSGLAARYPPRNVPALPSNADRGPEGLAQWIRARITSYAGGAYRVRSKSIRL